MRCFAAVPIPAVYQRKLQELVETLEKGVPAVKWVAEGNFHVTLKFIGEVEGEKVPLIAEKLEEAAKGIPPLEISLDGIGTFPPRGRPRVIWVGLKERGGNLRPLAVGVDTHLKDLGFPRETREFSPHLTIGRVKSSRPEIDRKGLAKNFCTPVFRVPEIVLYRSVLRREGPLYSVIKKFPLG